MSKGADFDIIMDDIDGSVAVWRVDGKTPTIYTDWENSPLPQHWIFLPCKP